MATGEALLALLIPGPRHGYDLKRAHDDWFAGLRPLAFGQVYATLGRLQRDGLVEVAHTESGEGPERVIYELTAKGREQATAWLTDPVEPGNVGPDELVRKTLAAYRLNADPEGLMARQRAIHLRRMRALEPSAPTPSVTFSMATTLLDDHHRQHLDADLRWLEIAAARIREHPSPSPSPSVLAGAGPTSAPRLRISPPPSDPEVPPAAEADPALPDRPDELVHADDLAPSDQPEHTDQGAPQ